MGRPVLALVAVCAAVACAPPEPQPSAGGTAERPAAGSGYTGPYAGAPQVVGDSLLRFPGGAVYVPRVWGLRFLDTVANADGPPVLLLSGAECYECDAPRGVWLRIPGRPLPAAEADTLGRFAYPGRLVDYEAHDDLVMETTLFYGECLEGRSALVLQYATHHDMQPVTRFATVEEVVRGELRREELAAWPDSAAVLARVRAGRCRELPGEQQYDEP